MVRVDSSQEKYVLFTWRFVLRFCLVEAAKSQTQKPTLQSTSSGIRLHCLFRLVSWRGLSATRKLGLAFLFDVSFLPRFNCCRNRTGLTRCGVAGQGSDFARLGRGRVVEFTSLLTCGCRILSGGFARGLVILARLGARCVVDFRGLNPQFLPPFPYFFLALPVPPNTVLAQ